MTTEINIINNNSGSTDDNNSDVVRSYSINAKKALGEGNIISAYELFNKANSILGCGYCKLMMGEKEEAYSYLTIIKNSSSYVNWLLELIKYLNNDDTCYPTYMQIRNFYEQDLDMFFQYQRNEYINQLLKGNDFWECFNKEIYKYTARVLYNHNLTALAEAYIKKSLDIYYNDPETHFILGEIYMKYGEQNKAEIEFRTSNSVINGYLPAQLRLKNFG